MSRRAFINGVCAGCGGEYPVCTCKMQLSVQELSIGGVHTRYRVAEDGLGVSETAHTREEAIRRYLFYRPERTQDVADQLGVTTNDGRT